MGFVKLTINTSAVDQFPSIFLAAAAAARVRPREAERVVFDKKTCLGKVGPVVIPNKTKLPSTKRQVAASPTPPQSRVREFNCSVVTAFPCLPVPITAFYLSLSVIFFMTFDQETVEVYRCTPLQFYIVL